jgi:rhamnose transport system permease protein
MAETNLVQRIASFDTWNLFLAILAVLVVGYGIFLVPNFASAFNISQLTAGVAEKALLVLPMVLLIVAREIDLSVASVLALTSVIFGILLRGGISLPAAMAMVLVAGAILGAFNGYLVAYLRLPSLVVTLGTMAMYRGIGYICLGTGSINVFPESLTDFGINNIPGTGIPFVILPFLFLAPIFVAFLHYKPFGRRVYATGGNPVVALYSGINTKKLSFYLFVISGVVASIAGMVYTARLSNARANNALGMELDVITMVLLGGVSVWGGKGRITGVFWALILVATIRNILGINQVGGDAQGMVIGLLLIGSLLLSNSTGFLVSWFRSIGIQTKASG